MSPESPSLEETSDRLARRAFFGFVLTFILSRVVVFLVMSRRIPNLCLFLQDTHVHHLNFGIFLLAAVGAYTLFRRPNGQPAAGGMYDWADDFFAWRYITNIQPERQSPHSQGLNINYVDDHTERVKQLAIIRTKLSPG